LELQIGVTSEALEMPFTTCLILIKLRIADTFELFLWQRIVGFVVHVVFDGVYEPKVCRSLKGIAELVL